MEWNGTGSDLTGSNFSILFIDSENGLSTY